ncbi:MAG: response regulator, partial [Bdellovibrionota bacterium]
LLFDWQLPDGSGVKLLNEYQRGRAQNRIPALMCTSKDKVDNILEALRSGAHNYLIKPFTLETLAEKMAYAWDVSMREKKQEDE